jgi:DNA (cytosine-5)-methyltransferase 1
MDVPAAATYAANFGRDHLFVGSIEDWLDDDVAPSCDIVIGGPPCQGFSMLGSRNPHDPRNRLWRRYGDALLRMRPHYFVLENVASFLDSPEFRSFSGSTKRGRLKEYELQPYILNAAEFGVPQARRRAIVIGRHRDLPKLPDPVGPRGTEPSGWMTVREALAEVPSRVADVDLPDDTLEFYGHTLPGAFKTAQLHLTRRVTELSRQRYAAIPEGGNRRNLPPHLLAPCWVNHTTGSGDVMGRLNWDRPSVTIRTEFNKPEKGRYLHPTEDRPITHLEAALLQGFPLDYLWCGSKTTIARQIGNAVPVPLARELGEHIARQLIT